MSDNWTMEEIRAASDAMRRAGEMDYEEFKAEIDAIEKIRRFARRQKDNNFPCPRCGEWKMDKNPARNSRSRRIGVYVCDNCGTVEALEDYTGRERPLASWYIAQEENWHL